MASIDFHDKAMQKIFIKELRKKPLHFRTRCATCKYLREMPLNGASPYRCGWTDHIKEIMPARYYIGGAKGMSRKVVHGPFADDAKDDECKGYLKDDTS